MEILFDKKFLTIRDVADGLKRSVPTIYRLVREGKLNGFRCGNRYLFTTDDINKYLDECREG
jgi:excisionase family DNA binding protein